MDELNVLLVEVPSTVAQRQSHIVSPKMNFSQIYSSADVQGHGKKGGSCER